LLQQLLNSILVMQQVLWHSWLPQLVKRATPSVLSSHKASFANATSATRYTGLGNFRLQCPTGNVADWLLEIFEDKNPEFNWDAIPSDDDPIAVEHEEEEAEPDDSNADEDDSFDSNKRARTTDTVVNNGGA